MHKNPLHKGEIHEFHIFLLYQVGTRIKMDVSQVEENVLDTGEQVRILNLWMEKDSPSRAIMFYYQEADYLPLEECGRHMPGTKGQKVRLFEFWWLIILTDVFYGPCN